MVDVTRPDLGAELDVVVVLAVQPPVGTVVVGQAVQESGAVDTSEAIAMVPRALNRYGY